MAKKEAVHPKSKTSLQQIFTREHLARPSSFSVRPGGPRCEGRNRGPGGLVIYTGIALSSLGTIPYVVEHRQPDHHITT